LLKRLGDNKQHTWYEIQNLGSKTRPNAIGMFDTHLENVRNE